jgi:hypothetical protein
LKKPGAGQKPKFCDAYFWTFHFWDPDLPNHVIYGVFALFWNQILFQKFTFGILASKTSAKLP